MKRRTLKKQIPELAQQIFTPTRKYLAANARVHKDILYRYERELERGVVELMRIYLILDPFWPHRVRWLDGLSEEFSWKKKDGIVYGNGELFWGHCPEVSRETTGWCFTIVLRLCTRHGVEYVFTYGSGGDVRSYYSRRCCPTRVQQALAADSPVSSLYS